MSIASGIMKVIGIVGLIGAGKDTAADYIAKKYGYHIISFRDLVNEVTEKEGLEPNRENLQMTGKKYREKYGKEYFSKLAVEKAKSVEKSILKEMRTKEDVELPKKVFGKSMVVINIGADKKNRFERLKKRARIGDPKNMEEFEKQEEKEVDLGYTKAIDFADITIKNNGTFDNLYKRIHEVMKSLSKAE